MAKTQLNVRVDEATAEAARERALQRGVSMNRYIEELVLKDAGEVGQTFVDAAADFMKRYEHVFAEEFGPEPGVGRGRAATPAREGQPGAT
ncbi:toxin-antitoxin system HicB family antitoxin [Streptomyces halobius]|uniref:Toxin-antitoxin system HicB family antitoxin n=1 Tax=Streptomyces halobius TaxID=2879846 RepID=A0ABY4M424_9ACTN|nr:toxin-antitoxin system HicB family antitoxin [Streptomyces halobius]UQA90986.1 toxin-antitoxin system HicB family antitoxin [Streptomyces halobius]